MKRMRFFGVPDLWKKVKRCKLVHCALLLAKNIEKEQNNFFKEAEKTERNETEKKTNYLLFYCCFKVKGFVCYSILCKLQSQSFD